MSAAEYKDQGNKHLQAKEFDAAIACYSKAIEINPNDHVFYSNRSAGKLSLLHFGIYFIFNYSATLFIYIIMNYP